MTDSDTTLRHFTRAQAEAMLPLVSRIVDDLQREFGTLRIVGKRRRELDEGGRAESKIGRYLAARVDVLSERCQGYLAELEDLGAHVLDMELGVVRWSTNETEPPGFYQWSPDDGQAVRWWQDAEGGKRRPV